MTIADIVERWGDMLDGQEVWEFERDIEDLVEDAKAVGYEEALLHQEVTGFVDVED